MIGRRNRARPISGSCIHEDIMGIRLGSAGRYRQLWATFATPNEGVVCAIGVPQTKYLYLNLFNTNWPVGQISHRWSER